ncbi:MAG: hypothetical protein K0S37_2748 [Microbacterium sp.]|jgi:hypothetical protein|nr:hypothetical protein [Microbacterium sp.]
MIDLREKNHVLTLGFAAAILTTVIGLAGCSSPSTTSSSDATAGSSATAGDDDNTADDDADDESDDDGANDVTASTFDTATAVVSAFVDAGGVCTNPVDSHLSIATSSIDCLGPNGRMQTIAVFATPAEAKSWYDAQTEVKVDGPTSYLLGENWAMVGEGTSMNNAQTLGVRDQSLATP